MTPAELRAARRALGLTQAALAARLGVTATQVYRWETNRSGWPDYLELAIERLLFVKATSEDMTPEAMERYARWTWVAPDLRDEAARGDE